MQVPTFTNVLSEPTLRRLCADFGARVKAARKDAKLSPKELGGLVGLSRSSIANLESGRQRVPIHVVWRLADALGVSLAQLLPEPTTAPSASRPAMSRVLKQEPRLADVPAGSKRRVKEFIETKLAEIALDPSSRKEG